MSASDLRVDKLEKMIEQVDGKWDKAFAEQIKLLQDQIDEVKTKGVTTPKAATTTHMCTTVVGGLGAIASKAEAIKWLLAKLEALSVPNSIDVYNKSEEWKGVLFAKFGTQSERDAAVGKLRAAISSVAGDNFWAKAELPPKARACQSFLLGLKWQLAQWGFERKSIRVDLDEGTIRVGPELAATVEIIRQDLAISWHGAWDTWTDLRNSPELAEILNRSLNILKGGGKGKGKAKGSAQ